MLVWFGCKGKGKMRYIKWHEYTEVDQMFFSTLFFFNLGIGWEWGLVNATPRPLCAWECPGTHFRGH